jgi:threonine synthase
VQNPTGIAQAILRGDPSQSYPYIRFICRVTGGQILSVSEEEIREAREVIAEREELQVCFASATALAGLIKMKAQGSVPDGAPVLVSLTGADRPLAPVPHDVIAWHN